MNMYNSLKYLVENQKGDLFHAWSLQEIDNLRELLLSLVDDAGYNLKLPPGHSCRSRDLRNL